MHICIDLNQSICLCMCLYVYDIQANMHLIQPLSESRYIQIHGYTCRYILVCIQYNPCICDMDCLISGAYVCAYVSCMCFIYIHIYQSICVLYVLQIHAHMHWQDHWWCYENQKWTHWPFNQTYIGKFKPYHPYYTRWELQGQKHACLMTTCL